MDRLALTYLQVSEARVLQLQYQFQTMCRGSKGMLKYLADVKTVMDELVVIDNLIQDPNVVRHLSAWVLNTIMPFVQLLKFSRNYLLLKS